MAVLDVTEYEALALDSRGNPIQTGMEPALVNQQVAIAVGSTASANAFGEATRFVRVHADAVCRIAFGENPTAAATSMRLAAGATEYFGVKRGPNATMKIAVIQST